MSWVPVLPLYFRGPHLQNIIPKTCSNCRVDIFQLANTCFSHRPAEPSHPEVSHVCWGHHCWADDGDTGRNHPGCGLQWGRADAQWEAHHCQQGHPGYQRRCPLCQWAADPRLRYWRHCYISCFVPLLLSSWVFFVKEDLEDVSWWVFCGNEWIVLDEMLQCIAFLFS